MGECVKIVAVMALMLVVTVYGKGDPTDECSMGCENLITGPYGIADSSLTAITNTANAKMVRMTQLRGWWPAHNRLNDWVQAKFSHMKLIVRVQTKGCGNCEQFVVEYKISYSTDCTYFADYMENGKIKVFSGNYDRNTLVTHELQHPVRAMCVRITIIRKYSHPLLRLELIGRTACQIGSMYWRNSCYSLVKEKVSWLDADGYCRRRGGNLVIVDSAQENAWLESFIHKQVSHYSTQIDKDCPGTALGYIDGRSEADCLRHCLKTAECTGFVTEPGKKKCWWKSTCRANGLVKAAGRYAHLLSARVNDVWINLNRLASNNKWEVKRDIPAKFFNWAYKQPVADPKIMCANMSPSKNYKWQNAPCDTKAYFICESIY